MSWKNCYLLFGLMLVCIFCLTGCVSNSATVPNDNEAQRWELIGEWRYSDEMQQYYINLLDIDFDKNEVMMNYSFSRLQGQSNALFAESRDMLIYPLDAKEDERLWQVSEISYGFEVLIQNRNEITVNAQPLTRKKTILTY